MEVCKITFISFYVNFIILYDKKRIEVLRTLLEAVFVRR